MYRNIIYVWCKINVDDDDDDDFPAYSHELYFRVNCINNIVPMQLKKYILKKKIGFKHLNNVMFGYRAKKKKKTLLHGHYYFYIGTFVFVKQECYKIVNTLLNVFFLFVYIIYIGRKNYF